MSFFGNPSLFFFFSELAGLADFIFSQLADELTGLSTNHTMISHSSQVLMLKNRIQ